jgi:hypothetical protein
MSRFTPEEMRMILNTDFFPAKAGIIRKFQDEFMSLRDRLRTESQKELSGSGPRGCDWITGQLVKGERFQDFPYVYLDFPKFFSKDEMFTFRSFFWWGHALFFCWFLSGPRLEAYKERLLAGHDALSRPMIFLSIADSPWEWSLEKSHAAFLNQTTHEHLKEILKHRFFLKIGCSLPLTSLETPEAISQEGMRIFGLLKSIVR